jgi:hypothetical protein
LGLYLVNVCLSDGLASASKPLKINMANTPPFFVSEKPKDFTMNFNITHEFVIPPYKDNESHPVIV